MRKFIYMAVTALTAFAASGCAKVEEIFTGGHAGQVTLVATFADQTRTSYKGGGKVDWEEGDVIRYYTKKGGSVEEYEVVRSGHSTNVVADVTSGTSYIIAAYGGTEITDNAVTSFTLNGAVKATQTGAFEDAHVSVAKTFDVEDGASLSFHNMTSLIKFTLERSDVSYITFTANAGEKIHGDGVLKITFEDDQPSASFGDGGGSAIRVNVNGAGVYYIATLPVKLGEGFTIGLYGSSNQLVGMARYSKSVTISDNEILNFDIIDNHIVLSEGALSTLIPGKEFNALMQNLCGGDLSSIKGVHFITRTIPESGSLVSDSGSSVEAYASFDSATGIIYVTTSAEYFDLAESAEWMFRDFVNCSEISGLQSFKTENCINTRMMFRNCQSLKEVNLSSFDFGRDTSMYYMFASDTSLARIIWPEVVDCKNLLNICSLFRSTRLAEYDLTPFKNLHSLNFSTYVFAYCPNCQKVIFPPDVDFSNIVNNGCGYWFYRASMNQKLDLTGINTETLPTMEKMFEGCYAGEIDCTGWDTGNATSQAYLFDNCQYLHTLRLGDKFLGTSSQSSTCWFASTNNKPGGSGAATQTGIVPGYVNIYCSDEVKDWVSTRLTVKYVNDGYYNGTPCPVSFFNWKTGENYFVWSEPEYVDLGLSVKWAAYNLGANAPSEYGGLYQWAGMEDVSAAGNTIGWSNCPYHTGSSETTGWTKYIPSDMPSYWSGSGAPDNKSVLDLSDDVANHKWGDKWRIPTVEEIAELINNCTSEWTTINGVSGMKLTSKKTGYTDKWIFLPAAGAEYGSNIRDRGTYGNYWTSTLASYSYCGCTRRFGSDGINNINGFRWNGRSVRPVYDDRIRVMEVSLSKVSLTMNEGGIQTLTATVTPSNATNKKVTWTSSDESVANVDGGGKVTAVKAGSATITVKTVDGGKSANCTVTVNAPEMVDLGLSVKWAAYNLGANAPDEYGGYYQWAGLEDVTSTSIYLDSSNCPYHTGSDYKTGWTKYSASNESSYWSGSGSPDNKTVLDPEDDVAHVKLGGKWRMPTREEWDELIDNCTIEWTTLNGVKGRKFTSKKNGNSIFLPAAGYRYYGRLDDAGSHGYYLSSSLDEYYPYYAYGFSFYYSANLRTSDVPRFYGQSVRRVYDDMVHVTGVCLSKSSLTMNRGDTQTLTATITPSNAFNKKVSWTSNSSVASVDASGKVTALEGGTATITVMTYEGGYTAKCNVTVNEPVAWVNLSKSRLTMNEGDTQTLTATITPSYASNKKVSWTSSNSSVASVDASGKVTALKAGTATITVTTVDGGHTCTCYVTVRAVPAGAVDMGLSVFWATCNLGASSPAESGGYYQWAGIQDVIDTSICLSYSNCPYHNGPYGDMGWTKYYGSGLSGVNTVLEPEDDVAHVKLGGNWRMPTKEEWDELIDNCTIEWTTLNGVKGRKFTSKKNGNSIFLPAAGCRDGGYLDAAGSSGFYWSSSLNTVNPSCAYFLVFYSYSGSVNTNYCTRYDGLSVRPVSD